MKPTFEYYSELIRKHLEEKAKPKNETNSERKQDEPSDTNPQGNINGLENYVLLPEGHYGNHDYPDILIAMNRLAYSEAGGAAQTLGLSIEDNEQGFIGAINWENAIKLNKALGNFTLSVLLGKEFLKLLRNGANGSIVYDGNGKRVPAGRLIEVYNDIAEVRAPWRTEYYDTRFDEKQGKLEITYPIFKNGALTHITEPLEECLMEDKTPGIDLNKWLDNSTSQGLPVNKTKKGNLYYWYPREGNVAGFYADSVRAILYCNWYPLYSITSLGVRAARVKSRS